MQSCSYRPHFQECLCCTWEISGWQSADLHLPTHATASDSKNAARRGRGMGTLSKRHHFNLFWLYIYIYNFKPPAFRAALVGEGFQSHQRLLSSLRWLSLLLLGSTTGKAKPRLQQNRKQRPLADSEEPSQLQISQHCGSRQ